ncbi:MAG: NnrU family protein [Alphaproteobacteria bacterium]|nr:NnrU family protein [Alphaproteobacteria bacterium]NNF24570.1 NnrU family protein [Paracoccaceae bacterium]
MSILTSGLGLWYFGHFFKRLAPGLRGRIGDAGKGVAAVVILAGLILIVIGYRNVDTVWMYEPPTWGRPVNNLLMLVSVFLFGLGSSKSPLRRWLRHPMLMGMLIWAVAHLLVNGDLASIVLFGALGIWTIFEMTIINQVDTEWHPPEGGTAAGTVRLLVITVVVYAVISGIHIALGYNPFVG